MVYESGATLDELVEIMNVALTDLENSTFSIPPSVVLLDVDQEKGLLYDPRCAKREEGAFVRGTEPTTYCRIQD